MALDTGWYGKLPSLGDFAGRRLPPSFVERWDAWLAAGLADWQAGQGAEWEEAYQGGPTWRFVAGPGVVSREAWAGVLMPSADRVGRRFPFTLARALPAGAAATAQATQLLVHWLLHAAPLAQDALHEGWDADAVDSALAELAEATVQGDAALDELVRLVAASVGAAGHVLWWRDLEDGSCELQRSQGLPQGAAFARLLSGSPLTTETN